MRPLTELDTVDWAGLEHACGDASDVPDLVRELATHAELQAYSAQ